MNPILQIIGYVKVICGFPHYCADLPNYLRELLIGPYAS